MREQAAIAADIAGHMRQLADVLDEFALSLQGKEQTPEAKPEPKAVQPSLEEVRTVSAKISVAGHSDAIREIIAKFGAVKLSDIAPEHYAEVLKEAESIGK